MIGPRLRGALLTGALVAAALTRGAASVDAAPVPTIASPCDAGSSAPYCTAGLGALRDVSASWRWYQAATLQPVPIKDYAADPEDAPPPVGAGICGSETVHQPASGPQIPPAAVQKPPIPSVPPPPGGWRTDSDYCVLHYAAADFTPLCTGCARMFVDFDAIPATSISDNPLSPGADGHYAMRLTMSDNNATALINGHSPNAKNLCSDKFFNPSPGADCANPLVSGFDAMGLGIEGDTSRYIHYPLEGRYFNGPAYLAGDGTATPYHWVHGFYMDIAAGSSTGAWYSAGYRGRGDVLPDTDQSYACPCEALHSSFSRTVPVTGLRTGVGGAVSPANATPAAGAITGAAATPDTAAARGAGLAAVALASGILLAVPACLRRRTRDRDR